MSTSLSDATLEATCVLSDPTSIAEVRYDSLQMWRKHRRNPIQQAKLGGTARQHTLGEDEGSSIRLRISSNCEPVALVVVLANMDCAVHAPLNCRSPARHTRRHLQWSRSCGTINDRVSIPRLCCAQRASPYATLLAIKLPLQADQRSLSHSQRASL